MVLLYYIENNIDGKIYVGQTWSTLEHRWSQHKTGMRCPRLSNAIRKHGESNFTINSFAYCDNQELADQEEIFWIAEMRRILGERNVYNIRGVVPEVNIQKRQGKRCLKIVRTQC